MLGGSWSGQQGHNPAGESPVILITRFENVAIPHPGAGNQPGYAWCKRPGCLEVIELQEWEQHEGLASMEAGTLWNYCSPENKPPIEVAM